MGDLEKAPNLANLCIPNAANDYSGAGANAVSRADKVFLTTPLSDVVWSPCNGLSLKCNNPGLTKEKAPILMSTEIFNKITSPPPTASGGKSTIGEDSTKTYLHTHSEDKIHQEATTLGLPQNPISVVDNCLIWSNEFSPGTLEDMKTMKGTSVIDITRDNNSSENKDKCISSPGKNQPIVNNAWASSTVGFQGPEDGGIADCLSHKPEELASNLAQVEAEHKNSNEESLQEHVERDLEANKDQYLSEDDTLVYDSPVFNRRNCPEDLACTAKFKDGKQLQSEDIANENCYNVVTSHFTYLHPLADKRTQTSNLKDALCSQHSFFNLIDAKSDCDNQVMALTSEPSNEREECIYPAYQREMIPLIEFPLSANVKLLDQCKDKARISRTERARSVSKEKDDSCGSVKSEPFVTGKRAWSFGKEFLMGSKRMKKSSDGNSFSGPNVREDSSFINWISSMTKGLFRSDHVETHSLALSPNPVPKKQRNLFSVSMSADNNNAPASSSVGFGSILKALYRSGLKGKSKIASIHQPEECASFKEPQLENLTIGRNTLRVNDDYEQIKVHKPVPISSVRIDQGDCQFGEPSPVVPNIPMSNSHNQEKAKDNVWENRDLYHVGSLSSSLHYDSSSPYEGKDASNLGSFILNKSSNSSTIDKAGKIPANAWITRFSPKVATATECTIQCNRGAFLEAEKRTDDCNMFLHHSLNDIHSVRDCQNSEDCRHSPIKDQGPTSEHLQQYSVNPVGLWCLEKVHTDLKTKSNLNRILPSQKLKKLEPMTSVFAKRLDAFKHIQAPEFGDDTNPENATCFFCGKNGHIITSCSDVTESEIEDLLKNINSLGGAEKSTCLCIRCFQHNHWAVVCPHASLNSRQHLGGNSSIINSGTLARTIKGRSDASLLSYHGVRKCKKGEDQQHQMLSAQRINCEDMSRNVTESVLRTSVSVDKKYAMKGKQIASTSGEAELRDKSCAHFHSLATKKKPDEQHKIFERIRKLRLSRTDVIRWMESSISHFSLEGFFLRVRLGKLEEGLGGTRYHVACISGTFGGKIYGGCKSHLPVNIGVSKCLIDSRFISNHDFVEDELRAWWSATLQRGGKLPSEEDLDKKLKEREMLYLESQMGS